MLSARRASQRDIGVVQRITEAAYAEYETILGALPLPVYENYATRIAEHEVWLVSRDGADAGVMVLATAPGYLEIFSLAVLPEARGGTGRWMLDFAENEARAAGLAAVRLYTNARMERNIRIYRQAGYRETGRRPNPWRPGWTFVDMAKAV